MATSWVVGLLPGKPGIAGICMSCATCMRCSNRPPTRQRSLSVAASFGSPFAAVETAVPGDEASVWVVSEDFLQPTTASATATYATDGKRLGFMGLVIRE